MKLFKLRDLIFIALIVVMIFSIGYMVIPFLFMMPVPAFRAIIIAPLYGVGVTLALRKTKRFGTVSLIGILMGMFLSVLFIFMIFIVGISGIITDLVCGGLFKGYANSRNRLWQQAYLQLYKCPLLFT